MWDLSGSGIEPVSPALASGFFTTEPPGKPLDLTYGCSQMHLQLKKEEILYNIPAKSRIAS